MWLSLFLTGCSGSDDLPHRGDRPPPDAPSGCEPGAVEVCDGVDNDCDGFVDDGIDADGDGHRTDACGTGDDCDDADAAVFPGAEETCGDGVDADCDGGDRICGFPDAFLLADATAKVYATEEHMGTGLPIRVGDTNGDGITDVLVATQSAYDSRGGGFVVPGPIVASAELEAVGYRVTGTDATDQAGRALGIGDVDGDGRDDVAFGAPYDDLGNGVYVVTAPSMDIRLDDPMVLTLIGPEGSYAGHGADLGDIDGDGVADAVVGAYRAGEGYAGEAYVKYGPLVSGVLDSDADAVLVGEGTEDNVGRVVQVAGDLDGDGFRDLLIAALGTLGAPASGGVYVVYGPPAGGASLSDADGRYVGASNDYAGTALASGDIDGDGRADMIVGSWHGMNARSWQGAAYVVSGPAGDNGLLPDAPIVLSGNATDQEASASVAAEDVDGDGRAEVAIGATGDWTGGSEAGAVFLFGSLEPGTWTMSDADAAYAGETSGDGAGSSVAFGDVDGDGAVDLVIGACTEGTGGVNAGAFYVVGL